MQGLSGHASANGGTAITLSPASASLAGCGTLEVQILVSNVSNLYGVDVRLAFDPSLFEVVDDLPDTGINITPSETFLTNLWVVRNSASNTGGTIWYAATQLNPSLPKSGSGVLATIHLRAKAPGTSMLSFSYTKLSDLNGVQIPASISGGTFEASASFAPSLSITKLDTSNVRLSWTSVSGAAGYRLYRAATPSSPYFTPTEPAYQVSTSLSYDDLGVLGDVLIQHYYTLKAACPNGFQSTASNRVGAYDYALRAASDFNYNDIAMVLETPISSASALAAYIGSSVRYVSQYRSLTQSWQTYISGEPETDFSLKTGQFVFVVTNNSAPASVAFVGGVPAEGSLSFPLVSGSPSKYNFISLPLDQGGLTRASEVAADFGTGISFIMRYRIETQSYQAYVPGDPDTDFSLAIGEPFALILAGGAANVWP